MSPPAFFKVFEAEISDRDLKIPLSFTQGLKQPLPEKVQLTDRHQKEWTVTVGRVGDCWHFLEGWDRFWRENFLTTGDVLMFEHHRSGCFYVVMFGPTATEKNIVQFTVPHADILTELDADDDELVFEQVNAHGGAGGNRNATQINKKHDCYGMEIFRAGLATQPVNPYFVTKAMQKRKSNLFVPMDVIKDFELDFGIVIKLVDPKSREFHGICHKWKDGRVVISGGWKSLCKMNVVKEGDKCICEFVQVKENRPRFLKVSFVRAMSK